MTFANGGSLTSNEFSGTKIQANFLPFRIILFYGQTFSERGFSLGRLLYNVFIFSLYFAV